VTKEKILNDHWENYQRHPGFAPIQAATRWLRYGYDINELRSRIGLYDRQERIAEDCRRVA
jgi:hypothetical protein